VEKLVKKADPTKCPLLSGQAWNTDCWAASVDFTCLSLAGNGALISPDIFVCAAHFTHFGDYTFISPTGTQHIRTVLDNRIVGGTGDMRLLRLSSPLPSTIKPALVFPSDWRDRLPAVRWGEFSDRQVVPWPVPMIGTNQLREVFLKNASGAYPLGGVFSTHDYMNVSAPEGHLDFNKPIVGGDSGAPSFFLFNRNLILSHCWHTSGNGPMPVANALLLDAIAALGGQPPSVADLTAFTTFQ
jgi:hypothetical protein